MFHLFISFWGGIEKCEANYHSQVFRSIPFPVPGFRLAELRSEFWGAGDGVESLAAPENHFSSLLMFHSKTKNRQNDCCFLRNFVLRVLHEG